MTPMFRPLSRTKALTGESPVWDDRRNCVWWIDIQGQRLIGTTMQGQDASDIPLPSMPGFVALSEDDRLVIGLEDGLWSIVPEGGDFRKLTDFPVADARLRANDGKPDAMGNLYFGVMDKTGGGEPIGAILRFNAQSGTQSLFDQMVTPNAICPAFDGSGLFFADTADRLLTFASIDAATGDVIDTRTIGEFASDELPDGMVVDASGDLWLAQIGKGRVVHLDKTGTVLGYVDTPVARPTMPAFAGPELDCMVLTSQRRFLGFAQLMEQPAAGQLLVCNPSAKGAPAKRVRLLP